MYVTVLAALVGAVAFRIAQLLWLSRKSACPCCNGSGVVAPLTETFGTGVIDAEFEDYDGPISGIRWRWVCDRCDYASEYEPWDRSFMPTALCPKCGKGLLMYQHEPSA